ncbi:MAG TPA: T9SS type A sorting domain-containing protein [bacterium]|jgi:hypothetical protein
MLSKKLWMVALAILALTAFASAQNFVACIYDDSLTLTTTCGGSTPLPEGTMMTVYYDANSNGPDSTDHPGTVCDQPPDCPSGPPGTLNMNQSPINGVAQGIGAGMFLTDPCLTSSGITPSPARYYLVINYPANNPTIKWTSEVFTVAVGPQDVRLVHWTCQTLSTPPACTPTGRVTFAPHGVGYQEQDTCAHLCPDSVLNVCVGPLTSPAMRPTFSIYPGCLNDTCTPASGFVFDTTAWQYQNINGQNFYCNTISLGPNGTAGCARVDFDFILPVTMGTVSIVPLDNAVSLKWNTLSESEFTRFDILRDGQRLTSADANNSPTGHEYSYVDRTALNGTTYTYQLVIVNTDGSQTTVATQAVSPGTDHALITDYALHQNYPNPFNPTTQIVYDLKDNNAVTLTIYNVNGQVVQTLLNNSAMNAGRHTVEFDAANYPSGLYFYTVKIGHDFSATRKMLLLK